MKSIKHLFGFFLVIFCLYSSGQTYPTYVQSGIVSVVNDSNRSLLNPFAGGLIFPVFASMDLNFDGKQDIVILDRIDEHLLTFINQSENGKIKFLYTPSFEKYFPDTLSRFVFLVDYNLDGKPDLYSYASFTSAGYEFYKNTGLGNNIKFERLTNEIPVTTAWDPSLIFNLYVCRVDIPVVMDVDGDGDVDILAFDNLSGAYFESFKNMSMEDYGVPDSLDYVENDQYWGYFKENDVSNQVSLGVIRTWYYKDPCWPVHLIKKMTPESDESITNSGLKRHIGSTTLAVDVDKDGDIDLLVGDVGYPNIKLLINGRTEFKNPCHDTIIGQIALFPPAKPVLIHSMPGIFYQDVDGDSIKDLIFSPMDEEPSDTFQSLHHVWLYKNMGLNDSLLPQFVQDDFLINEMIHTGGSTSPAFFDYDGDGDEDIFVVTRGNYPQTFYKHDYILLYQNIGKKDSNVFKLKDTNYMNLFSSGYENLSIAFGDIDMDGKTDMLLGNKAGKFIYYHNNAMTGQPANFSFVTNNYQGITIPNGFSTAAIADINKDSLNDIIAGGYYGRLFYYKNIGTKLNPAFTLENDSFCHIFIPKGEHYMAPAIADLDTNGKLDLVIGINITSKQTGISSGKLQFYYNITDNPDSTYLPRDTMIFYLDNSNKMSKSFKNPGKWLKPALADLDGDHLPDIVTGSGRGGLLFFGTNKSLFTKIISSGSTIICQGDTIFLDAGDGFDSYLWNTKAKTRKIAVHLGGNYSCTVSKGSLSYTANITVTAHSGTVKADFSWTKTNLSFNFFPINTDVDSIYWDFGDGSHSSQLNPTHTYSTVDSYSICMFIRDSCGATDTRCKKIDLTGINQVSKQMQLFIFPNPAKENLNILIKNSATNSKYEMRLYDLFGKMVNSSLLMPDQLNTLDIRKFSTGLFQLIIFDKGKMVMKRKIIIK